MYHVEIAYISLLDNIPHLSYYDKKDFEKFEYCQDFIQEEVNRLGNECGYTRIPFNSPYNWKVGNIFYNGYFHDVIEFQII